MCIHEQEGSVWGTYPRSGGEYGSGAGSALVRRLEGPERNFQKSVKTSGLKNEGVFGDFFVIQKWIRQIKLLVLFYHKFMRGIQRGEIRVPALRPVLM